MAGRDVAQCCTSFPAKDNFNEKAGVVFFFSSTLVKDGELPVERCHHCRHLGGGNVATHCSHGLVIQIKSLSPARNTAGNTTETTGNPVEANQQ